ncbi:MLP-like protein 43 [Beta vulgaris subsp. vulgaris]|uniref:MLP-like protein 43 n=1 Tax=Beta vulgaris subsp. vulgaris TaxID=3555 RepID=UPI0020371A3E|nr:MLP-like protein 43 [Beta vulgaris subsp. vulgaris]
MDHLAWVEGETKLKCDAEKFFEVWSRKSYLVSQLCPHRYPKIELHEGDWDKVGSVHTWTYVCNEVGEHSFVKIRVDEFDGENRCVNYSYEDGAVIKNHYKTLKSKIQVTPQDEGCIVKWHFDYEKMNENAPDPNLYIDFLLGTAKDIDACLCSA